MTDKPTTVAVAPVMTVKDLAEKADLKVSQLMNELIKQGVWVTINENVDFATAAAALATFNIEVVPEVAAESLPHNAAATVGEGDLRPPVVAMMGHVDHGKTSLLDAIRSTNVVAKEAGGITQHLSAYQITHQSRPVTFIDTPGHEAFAVLREHGAYLTDVAVIVVAADDGVKPQTIEAIKFAQKAGVKMVVAITKVDKPGMDLNRVKQQLSDQGLVAEEWGGETVIVEVSAKTKQNLDKLLEMIFLVADLEDLRAPTTGPAEGTVIEAHVATGQGPLATVLISAGRLRVGDYITAGASYGKARRLESTDGQVIKQAGPSYPVVVGGWRELPQLGDRFQVVADERTARQVASAGDRGPSMIRTVTKTAEVGETQELRLVLKADVHGSLESIIHSLEELKHEEVGVKIVGHGVGAISETDIYLAESAQADIVGFNVGLPVRIKQLAEKAKVPVRLYRVIYELLDDVRARLNELLAPEVVEETIGELEVQGVFRTTANSLICGGRVKKGKISADLLVRLLQEPTSVEVGKVSSVQKAQAEAKEVHEGDMCGLNIATKGKVTVNIGDRLEFFTRSNRARSI